jgi:glycosyltransferase involved in cell wall biosynthesis
MKTKKLHIVFLDFDDIKNPLLGAGQARATLEVGKRLVLKGHSITVISSRFPGYKDRIEHGITYKHIGIGTNNIRLNNLIYIFAIPFAVIKLKADIIIECFTAPISTLFSPLFTKIPVIALPTSFEAERFAKLYHLPFHLIEKLGLRFYKYALPYTKEFEEKMKKGNKKILTRIVPEGVDESFFRIKRKSPKHILFLGRFDIGQKGIDLLLAAYAQVKEKVKYPLVLAGFGPDEEKIKKIVQKLHLTNNVSFVGKAYGKEKEKFLSESLFVAFPSRHEGFSLFSLEALASGLPLVAFDIPGLSWATPNVVLKAKPFNVTQYEKLLIEASSEEINKKMSKDAKDFAKKYSWNTVADLFSNFLTEIVAKKYEN